MEKSRNQRIHQYLDGELRHAGLNAEELREVARHEEIIAETGRLHQSIEAPDLTASIMSRLPANAAALDMIHVLFTLLRRPCVWLWAPRPVRLRPAYGIAAAAALLLLTVFVRNDNPPLHDIVQTPDVTVITGKIFVQFRLDTPQASAVHLVGSFTGWKPTYTLHETAPGVWSVLVPLEPGVHDYAFLVNGKWITDPVAPVVDDGFGGANSRLLVVLPDGGSRL